MHNPASRAQIHPSATPVTSPLDAPDSGEERALVAGVRAGQVAEFERMFHQYYRALCAFVYGYVGARDVAEDLVQDTLCRIWEHRAEWAVETDLRGYLYGAARNRALNYLQRQRIEQRWGDHALREMTPSGMGQGPFPSDALAGVNQLSAALRQAVARLPDRRREAFTLRWQHRLSNREIAAVMGISEKGVEITITKALATLREELREFF